MYWLVNRPMVDKSAPSDPSGKGSAVSELLTGGEAIVQGLVSHGVDTVFALPGAQIYGLIDALAQSGDRITTIGARHEQTAAYMAFGYARALGKPGVCAVVPGPGILNAASAILTAHSCNAPILAITGDVTTHFKNRERGQLHEIRNQLGLLREITKWAGHIESAAEAPGYIAQAFEEMTTGRQGAVALQMPWDVLSRKALVTPLIAADSRKPPEIDLDAIDAAASLLAGAKAPMIFVGSGALDASAEVTELAEVLGAPVVSFRGGRGVVSDDHPLGYTIAAGARLWEQTDVALVVGSRFELLDLRWRHRPKGLKIVRIDIDPAEMRRLPADIAVVGDAAKGSRLLAQALSRRVRVSTRAADLAENKAAAAAAIQVVQPQVDYLRVIRDVLPRDGFFVEEISQVGFASIFGFPVYKARTLVTAGFQGTLGFGFPTALGVKVAFPDKQVVSITGDGGFMFAAQELATAVQYGINLVTIVFNNNAYGNVLRDQQMTYAGRLLGSELMNPDFVRFAESFGVQAHRVATPQSLRPVLERAFSAAAPVLIEVPIPRGGDGNPWPFILPKFPEQTAF